MALFPVRRPTVGLHIGPRALTLVEVGREWRHAGRGWRLRQCLKRDLPGGVLQVSPTEPNIANLTILTDQLRTMLDGVRSNCVALSLPDQCARVALFDFETLPNKPAEIEALLRFRFQKDLAVPLGDARIAYRVFRTKIEGASVVRVLVAAVRQEIVGQYEQWCEQAGGIPVAIGLSSFLLFDACTAAMTTSARDALFLHVTEHGLTFLAFQQGVPVFLRVKSLPVPPADVPGTDDPQTAPVIQELVATLHYYADRHLGRSGETESRQCPLYLVKAYGEYQMGRRVPDLKDPLSEAACEVLSKTLSDQLQVRLMTLDWNVLRVSSGSTNGPLSRSGLPAIAAMLAA